MVKARRSVVADSCVAAADLSFPSVWRELKRRGWTRKPPPRRELDERYYYTPPDGDRTGTEGVDFFRGEQAVLEFYAQELRTVARAFSSPTTLLTNATPGDAQLAAAARVVAETYAADIDAAEARVSSQQVTSAACLIPTSPHVGSDDASVESAEDGSEDVPDGAVASTYFLDDVSVDSSQDESDHNGSEDDEIVVSALGSELLANKDDDLNAVETGDDTCLFGVIESGDEAEKDDVDEGEYDSDVSVEECYPREDDDDDPEQNETEIASELLFAKDFLESFGGENEVLAGNLENPVLRNMTATGWEDVEEPDIGVRVTTPYDPLQRSDAYPGLRQGYSGPTAEAVRHGNSPMALFFFFMPVVLWQHIAACSNEYHREMMPFRVDEAYRRYKSKRRKKPELPRKTRRDVQHEMEVMKPIMPHELCRFIGLLVARTIAPNRETLSNHWKTVDVGAISRGCFGSVLSRDRFMEISRNLHFNANRDPRAFTDRAWKIRKVVEVLQRTFSRGYVPPSHLAFDEAVLPSRSSFNKMRVYLKDKPHKWGTKLFMLCSARTAYCIRFEVYCGKKQHASDAHKQDMKSGPAAVVRNLLEVFGPEARKQGMRLVVVDRFYTSVALAIQLLLLGFDCVGTIMTNRLGYCKQVIENKKSRPKTIPRGSFKVAKSKHVPGMKAISWWDSRPVHFLCTGSSAEVDVALRQNGPDQVEVPCQRAVKDYHAFMGGVDVHDQLRLQRYSLQRALRFKKYYKSLVLVLIDLAIVNSYIVHKAYYQHKESRPLTHVKFTIKLHLQMTQLQATDMYEGNAFGTQQRTAPAAYVPVPVGGDRAILHTARQVDEWRNQGSQAKRRQRACKVCSTLRTGTQRASTTTYFCPDCNKAGPIFLCMRARREVRGVAMACWDIWHKEWVNGTLLPLENARPIRLRRKADGAMPGTPSTTGSTTSSKRHRTTP